MMVRATLILSAGFVVAAAGGWAWQGPLYDKVTVHLPYQVTIQDKVLPPGQYTIQEHRSAADTGILHIFSDNGMSLETTASTIDTVDKNTARDTKVVLHHFGNDYYFDKIWIQGKNYGYEFVLPDNVKSRERERKAPLEVSGKWERAQGSKMVSSQQLGKHPAGLSSDHPHAVNPDGRSRERLMKEVRHELVMLPYYGVFDNLAYRLDGNSVTLLGQVSRPTLKTDAERVVKGIEGVENVNNEVEVLPVSSHDDQIRIAAYRAIYGHTALNRYALQAVPPIHIIVKNGTVTLEGVVASESDKNIANLQANSVAGVFSVQNNLRVEK